MSSQVMAPESAKIASDLDAMPLRVELIDTHVHLNFSTYEPDLDQVAQRWREAGITQLVHSCCRPGEFDQLQQISARYPEVFLAVGLHPLEASLWTPAMADQIQQLAAAEAKVVAIGETGLDFYKSDPTSIDLQFQAFRSQLATARELDLAVIIHCREAAVATRDLLDEVDPEHQLRLVMHCWSGTPEETQWFVERGCWISFSGIVTFKSAKAVKQSVLVVPPDQLLVETDCPFLAPTPHRGKRNEPAFVSHVAAVVADLRQQSLADLAHQTSRNARHLFKLPIPSQA